MTATRALSLGLVLATTFALSMAVTARAGPQDSRTIRYSRASGAGVVLGAGGGLGLAFELDHEVAIPRWATAVTISITDDNGTPVAVVAAAAERDAGGWADGPRAARRIVCSSREQTMGVPPGGRLSVRLHLGPVVDPGPCGPVASIPTRGVIVLRFTR
ncbi:MAG TPA: hypothetical protein VM030_00030 [Acidimicrobiales bacterium]|nr:hypothetical protein [Acidimicrobiales bacterium]